MIDDPGYLVAVAEGLVFALGPEWERLAAHNGDISRERVCAALDVVGVRPSFGDGELPDVPGERAADVEVLRDQLRWIREAAPHALASGADTFSRILCTDPWPRIYTTAVLDVPATSPVHVIQASDLGGNPQWARVGELARFTELRVLIMFGAPLGREPWPLTTGFRELQALDLSGSRMRALPASLAHATALEAIELADNPIEPASLAVLAALPRLRYVGLRNTRLTRREVPRLPPGCELAI